MLLISILSNPSHVLHIAHAVETEHDFANCLAAVEPVKWSQHVDDNICAQTPRRTKDGLFHTVIPLVDITLYQDNLRLGIGFDQLRREE